MKRFINFGSIEDFTSAIRGITHMTRYRGKDENGESVYDTTAPLPKLVVSGSEKLHGTHMGFSYSIPDGFWFQKRTSIIEIGKDNAGCAEKNTPIAENWIAIAEKLAKEYDIDLNEKIITIYAEFVGGNIQKNSALTGVGKTSVIFQHFKVSPIEHEETEPAFWYETKITKNDETVWVSDDEVGIYNIMNFPSYSIEIDFNHPKLSQNEMIRLVEEIVEPASPVGKAFGQEKNIGEGIVFTVMYKGSLHKFKVKGNLHTSTKVKTLKPVDDTKEMAKVEFANYAANAMRLEQAWQNTFGIENEKCEPTMKMMGDFLKAVMADVVKEELTVLHEKGLEIKDVSSKISDVSRGWFKEQLDSYVFGKSE